MWEGVEEQVRSVSKNVSVDPSETFLEIYIQRLKTQRWALSFAKTYMQWEEIGKPMYIASKPQYF